MKRLIAVIVFVGCGGDDDSGISGTCRDLSMSVTQTAATCRLNPFSGPLSANGCPIPYGEYCGDEFGPACGTRQLDCYGDGVDCTFAVGPCTNVDSETISFPSSQTLNGQTGLLIQTGVETCEFHLCNPL